jgi:hypothetical protein
MATALIAAIKASVSASYANSQEFGSVAQDLKYSAAHAFTDGAGADQAQKLFTDQRTLAASANESLDLAGGLTDAFGATLTLTKVKALLIKAADGNTNNVVVGGAASNGWVGPFGDVSDTVAVKPGGTLLLVAPNAAGYAVTAGTGDILQVANSGAGTGVTYDIVIVGV